MRACVCVYAPPGLIAITFTFHYKTLILWFNVYRLVYTRPLWERLIPRYNCFHAAQQGSYGHPRSVSVCTSLWLKFCIMRDVLVYYIYMRRQHIYIQFSFIVISNFSHRDSREARIFFWFICAQNEMMRLAKCAKKKRKTKTILLKWNSVLAREIYIYKRRTKSRNRRNKQKNFAFERCQGITYRNRTLFACYIFRELFYYRTRGDNTQAFW